MSLDNVIAVVGVANQAPEEARTSLILIGLALSIPLIIFGSTILLKIMDKFPIMVSAWSWITRHVGWRDVINRPFISGFLESAPHELHWALPVLGIAVVLAIGYWLKGKHKEA
jgi:predicted tellurium resistance membrane protein TerC